MDGMANRSRQTMHARKQHSRPGAPVHRNRRIEKYGGNDGSFVYISIGKAKQ
jgi:hypothetical protein